jgi:hypothetical protein
MRGGALVKLLGTLVVVASTVALALALALVLGLTSSRRALDPRRSRSTGSLESSTATRSSSVTDSTCGSSRSTRPRCTSSPSASGIRHRLRPNGCCRTARWFAWRSSPPLTASTSTVVSFRYVIRARDGVDVNIRLVAIGAAAPYFYDGRRGRYADRLESQRRARTRTPKAEVLRPGPPGDTTRTTASRLGAQHDQPERAEEALLGEACSLSIRCQRMKPHSSHE